MLETVKENRSSDFSFTDYLHQEIENQACNIKTLQLNIDDQNLGIKNLMKKNASFTNLRSHLSNIPDMGQFSFSTAQDDNEEHEQDSSRTRMKDRK